MTGPTKDRIKTWLTDWAVLWEADGFPVPLSSLQIESLALFMARVMRPPLLREGQERFRDRFSPVESGVPPMTIDADHKHHPSLCDLSNVECAEEYAEERFQDLLATFYSDPEWVEPHKMTHMRTIEFCRRAFSAGGKAALEPIKQCLPQPASEKTTAKPHICPPDAPLCDENELAWSKTKLGDLMKGNKP